MTSPEPRRPAGAPWRQTLFFLILISLSGWFYYWAADGIQTTERPADIYGMQLQSWLEGHTYLDITPPPELLRLANPYDPKSNVPGRLLDISFYKGHYYSYYGPTSIVVLTLPWHFVTGTYLSQRGTIFILVFGALLLSLFLLRQVWRQSFAEVPFTLVALAAILLSFGNLALLHLAYGQFYQVAQASATFWQIASLACCLASLRARAKWRPWLIAASLAAGLALASRPNFLFSGISLLPVALAAGLLPGKKGRWTVVHLLDAVFTAAWPAGLVCASLLYYNWVRFDSAAEFGSSYVLSGDDQRMLVLMSFSYVPANLRAFLINPINWTHYFPFLIEPIRPIGLIYFPFLFLAPVFLVALWRRGREIAWFAAALLGAGLATFVSLVVYVVAWTRYEVDFFVPLILAAALGWIAAYHHQQSRLLARRLIFGGGLILAAITLANVLALAASTLSARMPTVAFLANATVAKLDQLRGYEFGQIELDVSLPAFLPTRPLPLVTTGFNHGDRVYLEPVADGQFRIGYFHEGLGGPVSEPFALAPSSTHHVRIAMGSLLPPKAHPYFHGWSEMEIYQAIHLLTLSWDGREIVHQSCDFYESGPRDLQIGSPGKAIAISASHRVPFPRVAAGPQTPAFAGFARLQVRFPARRDEHIEPLLSTGRGGDGALLFVHYLPDGTLQFGVNRMQGGLFSSGSFSVDRAISHTIYLKFGGPAGAESPTAVEIVLDGMQVTSWPMPLAPTSAATVFWGTNAVGSTASGGMFSGTFTEITAISEQAFQDHRPSSSAFRPGPIAMHVRFNYSKDPAAYPLIVTGLAGAGDFLYVVYDSDHEIHFGMDHWGYGGLTGKPVSLSFAKSHQLTLEMGSLWQGHAPSAAVLQRVRITLDGVTVLEGTSPAHPATAAQIAIGVNPIGGSTCAPVLCGSVISVHSVN